MAIVDNSNASELHALLQGMTRQEEAEMAQAIVDKDKRMREGKQFATTAAVTVDTNKTH